MQKSFPASGMDHETDRKLVAAAANTNQPQQKTQPRSILTEEDYTDTLTQIVTRELKMR